jgi:hypothetical protein
MYSSKRPDKCKRSWKKDQKSWKKVLTNGAGSGNIVEHLRDGSSESESRTERKVPSTLKIKQRKKQGTLRFASEKTQQSNSGKRKFLGKIRAEQALKLIVAASADMIQILESLILAQDERWRRA